MTSKKSAELVLVATSEKPAALIAAEKKTKEQFESKEDRQVKKGTPYVRRAEGQAVCETLLPDLAAFMRSREAPAPPKGGLSIVIRELEPEELALVALSSLLNAINQKSRKRPRNKKKRSNAEMKLKLAMGRTLHEECLRKGLLKQNRKANKKVMQAWKYREPSWSNEQYVQAGNWMLACVMQKLNGHFVRDRDGFPGVTEEHKEFVLRLRAELIDRNPVFLPTTEPLQDWTGWRSGGYWDDGTRISATFVRDSHPDMKKAIKRAFGKGVPHIEGVNALQRVGWRINQAMLPVVREFAGKSDAFGCIGKRVSDLQRTEDIATAERLGDKTFRIPMNCDKRGRVYGIPHFNFQREDHVRALFQFAEGMPIGQKDRDDNWIMIHVATCGDFDGIGKRIWPERIQWVKDNSDMIMRIAREPEATVDLWRKADAPFSFVAACMEMAGVWETGPSTTRLPICFDGSCSGIQHLAMITRDEDAGRFVNLIADDEPHDVYQLITNRVKERLQTVPVPDWKKPLSPADAKAKAGWWLRKGIDRKLVKRPAMTFAYSATLDGMQEHLDEIEDGGDTFFLAWHIMEACKETLRRPAEAMKFIRALAKESVDKGKVLEWVTPTGFPWANRYYKSKFKRIDLELCGVSVKHKVADGYKTALRRKKSLDAAAPNFVHALDASHLIRVVNTAASKGITSIAVVHDSFGCHAPHAFRLHQIIRANMTTLYGGQDVLAELREAAESSELPPAMGELDPCDVLDSTYAFA
jgi:DNA-directed RNA polymerase, mitochondrial